jgi:hypothetical protein
VIAFRGDLWPDITMGAHDEFLGRHMEAPSRANCRKMAYDCSKLAAVDQGKQLASTHMEAFHFVPSP